MNKKIKFLIMICMFVFSICNIVSYAAISNATIENEQSRYFLDYYGKGFKPESSGNENQIHYVSGATNTNVTDLSLPGKNGLDLNIVRSFSSQKTDCGIVSDSDATREVLCTYYKAYYYTYTSGSTTYTVLVGFDSEYKMVDEFYTSKTHSELTSLMRTDDTGKNYLVYDGINSSSGTLLLTRDKTLAAVKIRYYEWQLFYQNWTPQPNITELGGWEILIPSLNIDTLTESSSGNSRNFFMHFQDEFGKIISFRFRADYYDSKYRCFNAIIKSNEYTISLTEEDIEETNEPISYVDISDSYGKT